MSVSRSTRQLFKKFDDTFMKTNPYLNVRYTINRYSNFQATSQLSFSLTEQNNQLK